MNVNPEYIFCFKYDLYNCKEDKIIEKDLFGYAYVIDTEDCKNLLQDLKNNPIIENSNGKTREVNIREIEIFRPKNHLQKRTIEKWSNDDEKDNTI